MRLLTQFVEMDVVRRLHRLRLFFYGLLICHALTPSVVPHYGRVLLDRCVLKN